MELSQGNRLALGSGTRKTPRTGVCHKEKRLALGSGTDVKSQATFSSGPDPSVRQQAQMVAQFLTPLRPQYVKKRRFSPKYLELQLFLVTFATK
jgi:hypothetical protein